MSVYAVNNDTWTETGIAFNNAPAALNPALGVIAINNVGKYYEIDVTSFVNSQFGGDKVVSFFIKDATNQNINLQFNSKENAQFKPQLIIESAGNDLTPPVVNVQFNGTFNSPNTYNNQVEVVVNASDSGGSGLASTLYSLNRGAYQNYTAPFIISTVGNYTITAKAIDGKGNTSVTNEIVFSVVAQQSPPVTQTLSPLADAYVRDGSFGDINYGTSPTLDVKGSVAIGFARSSYLKFSLSAINSVGIAKLRIYGFNRENSTSINMSVYAVNNDTWTETGITFNNAPAALNPALGVIAINNVGKYYEIDVTSFVNSQFGVDKVVSFFIKDATNQNINLQFNSKENAQFKPQLVIENSPAIIANQKLEYNANILGSVNYSDKPKVYPNPLHKRFEIKFPAKYDRDITMQIVDELGKVYKIGRRTLGTEGSTIPVNITNLNLRQGLYFLKIQSKTRSVIIKLIVQ